MTASAPRTLDRLTVSAAIVLTLSAAAAFALAITLAPPRSGPNCLTEECVEYPYTEVAAWAPTEYWWMLPAAVVPLALTIALMGLRDYLQDTRRRVAGLAVLLAMVAALVLVSAYAIQWMVVIPSLFAGEAEQLALWSQYNPHGLFIALENVGYLFASLALLAAAWLIPGRRWRDRAARWVAGGFGGIGVLGLPVLAFALRSRMEYQYEVLAIVVVWVACVALGPLLVAHLMGRDASTITQRGHADVPRHG